MLYLTIITMEININCDLGEKSKHHSNKHDPDLLTSLPKSQYKAASPRFDIFFIMTCYT